MTFRIFHIVSGLKVGGAEMVLYRLIQGSKMGGYSHLVISLTPEGAMYERFTESGISVLVYDFRKKPCSEFWRLLRFLRKERPDIVQTWMYHSDLLGGLAARLAGIRNIIWGVRTTDLGGGYGRKIIRLLCARLSRLIPEYIVCAAEASRRSHISIGYDAARMKVVPNGFDLYALRAAEGARSRIRDECGFTSGDFVIGTLGRFNEAKDQRNFIRAAAEVTKYHSSARFLMVGRDLEAVNAVLSSWLREFGITDRFVLLGERKDAPACLAAMDIFCLSSRTEGFPNALGEAMAMGLPCVTTDVGDAVLLLGGFGAVVPAEDSVALANGLREMIEMTEAERLALGKRTRERIESEFTLERTLERFEELYTRLLGS